MPAYALAIASAADRDGRPYEEGARERRRAASALKASWPGLFSQEETAILSQAYLAAARHLADRPELRPACDVAHRRLVSALIASAKAGVWTLSHLTASALRAAEASKPPTIVFPAD